MKQKYTLEHGEVCLGNHVIGLSVIVELLNKPSTLESKLNALSRCVLDIDTTVCVVASNPQLRDAKAMAALNLRDENKHNLNDS